MRILLDAACDAQRLYLARALTESLNSVETTDALRHAGYLLEQEPFDAIVACAARRETFDELLATVKALRAQAPDIVLVMLFAHASPAECARFLRAGADACFVQPYSIVEISERLRILERTDTSPAPPCAWAQLDPATREFRFTNGAHAIALTRREYLLLDCLLRAQGLPVSRERLTRYVWPEKDDAEPGSLNLLILRLRRKLGASHAPPVIQTLSRHGYCLRMPATSGPDNGDN